MCKSVKIKRPIENSRRQGEVHSFHRSLVIVRSVVAAAEEIKHVAVVVATAEKCEIRVGDRWPYIITAQLISNNYVGEAGVGTLRRVQGRRA